MPERNWERLLGAAVDEVLETMFFSQSFGPCQPDLNAGDLMARVPFTGETSGWIVVRISEPGARNLAASFLGESEESLSDLQIRQVVCELTNMLCGDVVSKIASRECFDLGAPEMLSEWNCPPDHSAQFDQTFAVEQGTLTVSLSSSVLS